MSNKKRKHKNATAGDDGATNQSPESSMRETLNDFAYFQEVWDKSITQPTSTAKERKSNKQNNMMLHDDDDISTTSSLQSSHFSGNSGTSSNMMQTNKKRRKSNTNKHNDVSITNAKDIHNKKEEDTKTSKKGKGCHRHRQHPNSYQTLYHNTSIAQVDELVGWAHSHSDNTNHNVIDGNNSSEVELERGIVDLTHSSTTAPPPPPSHIAYLQHQIADKLEAGNSSTTAEDTSDERRDRSNKGNNIRRDVDTSTYSTISKHNHNINLDTSAYVAIGMAIEESLLRSLMPLAYKHVERCRRLERRDTSSSIVSGGIDLDSSSTSANELTSRNRLASDPFHAWTLPAAEAVAELAKDGYTTSNDAIAELLGVSQSKEKSGKGSKDSSSSASSTSSSSDDS